MKNKKLQKNNKDLEKLKQDVFILDNEDIKKWFFYCGIVIWIILFFK